MPAANLPTMAPPAPTDVELFGDLTPLPQGGFIRANSDRAHDRRVREAWRDAIQNEWENFSVFSIAPFEISAGPIAGQYFYVPEPAKDKPYSKVHIDTPICLNRETGGDLVPEMVYPKNIARDIVRSQEFTGAPSGATGCCTLLPDHDGKRELTAEELDRMKERRMVWYKKLLRIAQATWAKKPGQYGLIDPNAIVAANAIKMAGGLSKLPDWANETRDTAVETECRFCGGSIKRAAKLCVHCKEELDPEFWAAEHARRDAARNRVAQAKADAVAHPTGELPEQGEEAQPADQAAPAATTAAPPIPGAEPTEEDLAAALEETPEEAEVIAQNARSAADEQIPYSPARVAQPQPRRPRR